MKRRYAQGTRILLPSAHGIKDRRDDGLKDREFWAGIPFPRRLPPTINSASHQTFNAELMLGARGLGPVHQQQS